MKIFHIVIISFIFSFPLFGQKENSLSIDIQHLTSLKLSDFSEKFMEVHFDKGMQQIQFVYISVQNVYVATLKNIYQYSLSGKYIRTIDCGAHVCGISGDEWKRELYVPVSDNKQTTLKCYDESGNLLRTFPLDQSVNSCVYFENRLWMQQSEIQNDTVCYKLSNIDCLSGERADLGCFHKDYYWPGFAISSPACFSVIGENLFFSVNTDSTLYQVRGDRFEPYLRWNITPKASELSERGVLNKHIVAGRYLFVEYDRIHIEGTGRFGKEKTGNYLYVKAIKGIPEEYNVRYERDNVIEWSDGLKDDLYHTGYIRVSSSNKQNCLYFLTDRKDEQSGKKRQNLYLIRVKNKVR